MVYLVAKFKLLSSEILSRGRYLNEQLVLSPIGKNLFQFVSLEIRLGSLVSGSYFVMIVSHGIHIDFSSMSAISFYMLLDFDQ